MRIHTFLFLFLFLLITTLTIAEDSEPQPAPGKIIGKVLINGKKPMLNGIVLVYSKSMGQPPHPYRYWRIPDLISNTDSNGNFEVEVEAGTFYLMIAQKNPDGDIGPPSSKEFLYFHGNAKGIATPIEVVSGKTTNLGKLSKSFIWSPDNIPHEKGITAVEGTVTDPQGAAVENVVVFAYLNEDAIGRPAFTSDRSDRKGRFQLRLAEGGVYYLKVRGVIGGGAPQAGEFQSVTEEFKPKRVETVTGKRLSGITLKADQFKGKALQAPQQSSERKWKDAGSPQGSP